MSDVVVDATAVVDANVIVSASISDLGIPFRILQAARAGRFRWLTSAPIVAEVFRALQRPSVKRRYDITPEVLQGVSELLEKRAISTPLTIQVVGVATHSEDDLILATAASARANYLVTGDRQLLALENFRGTQIVSPRQFIEILEATLDR